MKIIICFIIIVISICNAHHNCVHDTMDKPFRTKSPMSYQSSTKRAIAAAADWKPMRFHIDMTTLDADLTSEATKLNFIKVYLSYIYTNLL